MTDHAPTVHLSIGEVLSLVQEEFPDVTISKIRFLESQGLIAPERTASGYRKFYDPDIDQLRWILRQQRDHFLPLKVIKKMIDQGADTTAEGSQQQLFAAADDAESPDRAGAPVPDDEQVDPSGGGPAAGAAGKERSAAHPTVASAAARRPSGAEKGSEEGGAADRNDTAPASGAREGGHDERRTEAPAVRPAPATPADIVAALQEDPGGGSRRRRRSSEAPAASRRSFADANPNGSRLSRDELLEAAGIDDELLDGLEQYGLVLPVTIGAAATYDADALEIARIAGRYAELGVEARHLRMYKVAAEREAGFVEQLVVPLVKQRNPTARQQAVERCDELGAMGSELHQALLRRHLGPLLGP